MVCEPCKAAAPATAGIDFEDFDEMVAPNENFYEFAIGASACAESEGCRSRAAVCDLFP
jgi:hypothetical protein